LRAAPLTAAALAQAAACLADAPAPDHPLIGTWDLTIPQQHCSETYEFRADGSRHTLSAAEESDGEYVVSAQPDAHGVYTLRDTITRTNDKPDCDGRVTHLSSPQTVTLYLAPLRGGFLMCFDAALEKCLGPMTRLAGPPPAQHP
jgi:hypothetical protein